MKKRIILSILIIAVASFLLLTILLFSLSSRGKQSASMEIFEIDNTRYYYLDSWSKEWTVYEFYMVLNAPDELSELKTVVENFDDLNPIDISDFDGYKDGKEIHVCRQFFRPGIRLPHDWKATESNVSEEGPLYDHREDMIATICYDLDSSNSEKEYSVYKRPRFLFPKNSLVVSEEKIYLDNKLVEHNFPEKEEYSRYPVTLKYNNNEYALYGVDWLPVDTNPTGSSTAQLYYYSDFGDKVEDVVVNIYDNDTTGTFIGLKNKIYYKEGYEFPDYMEISPDNTEYVVVQNSSSSEAKIINSKDSILYLKTLNEQYHKALEEQSKIGFPEEEYIYFPDIVANIHIKLNNFNFGKILIGELWQYDGDVYFKSNIPTPSNQYPSVYLWIEVAPEFAEMLLK